MIAAGCDLSTKALDLCVLDTETLQAHHRRVALTGSWWHDAGHMWQHLARIDPADDMDARDWLHHHRPAILGIERPYGPHRQAIAALHTILGAVLSALAIDDSWLPTLEVRPAEMRKHLGLKGNAGKKELHRRVRELAHGESPLAVWQAGTVTPWGPDALDALAVAWAAYRMCQDAADRKEV